MENAVEQATSQGVGSNQPSTLAHDGLSHAFKRLLNEHAAGFSLVKRLGMRSVGQLEGEFEPLSVRSSQVLREMAGLYAALREVVQNQASGMNDGYDQSDLAEAMAALDAINPGSPEWVPAFLLVSELVEAQSVASWQQAAELG